MLETVSVNSHHQFSRVPCNLIDGFKLRGEAAVHAEDAVADGRREREQVEEFVELAPQLERAEPFPALRVEPVHAVHARDLVVASKHVHAATEKRRKSKEISREHSAIQVFELKARCCYRSGYLIL